MDFKFEILTQKIYSYMLIYELLKFIFLNLNHVYCSYKFNLQILF